MKFFSPMSDNLFKQLNKTIENYQFKYKIRSLEEILQSESAPSNIELEVICGLHNEKNTEFTDYPQKFKNYDQLITQTVLEHGTTHTNGNVRLQFAMLKNSLTSTLQETGLNDKNQSIRCLYWQRNGFIPNPEQCIRGLQDPSHLVQMYCITNMKRNDITPPLTQEQLNLLLFDYVFEHDNERREAMASLPNIQLTAKQISVGLIDYCTPVRRAFAKRDNVCFTHEHIAIGLADPDDEIQIAFSKRLIQSNFVASQTEITRGISSNNPIVTDLWLQYISYIENQKLKSKFTTHVEKAKTLAL